MARKQRNTATTGNANATTATKTATGANATPAPQTPANGPTTATTGTQPGNGANAPQTGLAAFNAACANGGAAVLTAPTGKPAKKRLGVNPNQKTRAWAAGVVIAQNGHATGITPEMVVACGQLYGHPNGVEDEICLRNAWHAVRGYHGGTVPAGNPQPAATTA